MSNSTKKDTPHDNTKTSNRQVRSIIPYFYKIGRPYEIQLDIISQIEKVVQAGYDKIIISAPTGTGKSWIAGALALWNGSASILTSTKQLQDQYLRDFPWMNTIKGKKNFLCMKLNSLKDCSFGQCDGCEFKPKMKQFTVENQGTASEFVSYAGTTSEVCPYFVQLYEGDLSSFAVFNYASYMSQLFYLNKKPSRTMLICDEAHDFENHIVGFLSLHLSSKVANEAGLSMPRFSTESNLSEVVDYAKKLLGLYERLEQECQSHTECSEYLLSDFHLSQHVPSCPKHEGKKKDNYCRSCIEAESQRKAYFDTNALKCKQHVQCSSDHTKLNHTNLEETQNTVKKLQYIIEKIAEDPKNFVISRVNEQEDGNRTVIIQPVDVDKYVGDIFSGHKLTVFMSATVDKELFCKHNGLDPRQVAYITVPSTFAAENRPVYCLGVAELSQRTFEKNMPVIVKAISQILDNHRNDKGIIHVTSYRYLNFVRDSLEQRHKERLIATDSAIPQSQTVKSHIESPSPTVLISPSLAHGLDLKDSSSRFQIIVKVPYLDLGDQRIKEKMRRDIRWYETQTIYRIIQATGRSVRHENDYAVTYILDSKALRLLRSAVVPSWFSESLVFKAAPR